MKKKKREQRDNHVSYLLLFFFAFSLAPSSCSLAFFTSSSCYLTFPLSMRLTPALFCLLFHETMCGRRSNLSGDREGLQQRDSFPHLHHLVHRKQSFRIPLHIMNTSTLKCAEYVGMIHTKPEVCSQMITSLSSLAEAKYLR